MTKQLNSHIWSYSGHIKPLLMGKEKKKKIEIFQTKRMGARAHVIISNDYCWVFIAK